MNEDYYKILGVAKGATDKDIKAAYRKLALQWHPDKNKTPEAEKKFKEINAAYAVLSDPKKRQQYDTFGHAAFQGGGGGNPFQGGNPFGQGFNYTYRYGGGDGGENPFEGFGGFNDPFEIFEQFFGGANPFQQARRVPRYQVDIKLEDAYTGTEKQINVDGKRRKVNIPAGVDTGSQIRFDDFAVVINVEENKNFIREGADLIATVQVPLYVAVTGGEIDVPMIEGKTKIRIRPGTQSGAILRISGKGMPRLHGRGYGDFYIKLNVTIPTYKDLTSDQKEAIEKLKK